MPDIQIPNILVTGNDDKLREFSQIAGEIADSQLALPVLTRQKLKGLVEIQDIDVVQVGALKAIEAKRRLGESAMIEDTGVGFTALGGFPGALYKWINEAKDDGDRNLDQRHVLRLLEGESDRTGEAVTSICFADDQNVYAATGVLPFQAPIDAPRGENGWAFDSFVAPTDIEIEDGLGLTLAEMTAEQKNAVSMRRRAIENLMRGNVKVIPIESLQ